MNEKTIEMSKEDLRKVIEDWTAILYDNNPPKSIYDDLSYTIPEFLDGYFDTVWKGVQDSGQKRTIMDDICKGLNTPRLRRRIDGNRIKYAFPLSGCCTSVNSTEDEDTGEFLEYLVVIECIKHPDVKYIFTQDDNAIYIQYGWKHEPEIQEFQKPEAFDILDDLHR